MYVLKSRSDLQTVTDLQGAIVSKIPPIDIVSKVKITVIYCDLDCLPGSCTTCLTSYVPQSSYIQFRVTDTASPKKA